MTQRVRLQLRHGRAAVLVCAVVAGTLAIGAQSGVFSPLEKAFYADERTLSTSRPGLNFRITSAEIAADGTVSTVVSVTDRVGSGLDRLGGRTPGAVAMTFVAARIPKGQSQYRTYTTRTQTGPVLGTVTQAAGENNGTFTELSPGVYRYTFRTLAAGFDRTETHTVAVYGNRNLNEWELGTFYASHTFNFVPGGGTAAPRDVVKNAGCNRCHDDLAFHGGSRRGIETCVLCHTPQTLDPDTGNSVDMMEMTHKIHMGKTLPSVVAGRPYRIIGNNQSINDYSSVAYPADTRRCEVCHDQKSGAAQAAHYMTTVTRSACGSCHTDVNFQTGEGHIAGPQFNDNACAQCHIPKGEFDFDASVKGAHVVPTESEMLLGLVIDILRVDDGVAGRRPVVSFTVKDKGGKAIPLSALGSISLILSGPTTDYGKTSFGADVLTPGYVSESALRAECAADGTCRYTFTRSIPADARGTFAVGIEARRTEVLYGGTTKQRSIQYGAKNEVFYFSVDGSRVTPRRQVVSTALCNQCHADLALHGQNRHETELCVICHNPSETDARRRALPNVPAAIRNQPPHGVNLALMIHRIHSGERLKADGREATIVGFGGNVYDFTEVRYPAFSLNGQPGERRTCSNCHVGGSEQMLTRATLDVTDPQGPINPVKPITSACTGCHVKLSTASHALVNTSILGESCDTCHSSTSAFAVSKVHAQ